MKNKFLLLGATALLSAGALIANATNPEPVQMNVGVNIHRASTFTKTSDLNFGSVIIPESAKELHLEMESGGAVTAADESVQILGDAWFGITEGAPCVLLEYPSNVELDDIPEQGTYTVTASVSGLACNDTFADGIISDRAYFRAEHLDITSDGPLASGVYKGTFTITAVYPD